MTTQDTTSDTTSDTTITKVSPADFGDPEAFNLGKFTGEGSLHTAATQVRELLGGLSVGFGITRVQFSFNGTPAVMGVTDSPTDVNADYYARRTAYQSAANIT